jgi:protein-tyrosine phosphatase
MDKEKLSAMAKAMKACKLKKWDNVPLRVEPGVFLGSIGSAFDHAVLKEHAITHILCVATNIAPKFPDHFQYKLVDILDRPGNSLTGEFASCFAFIDRAVGTGGNVLVHCFQGKSRSAAVVIGYQMQKHNIGFLDGLKALQEGRPSAQPNAGFCADLRALEKRIHRESAELATQEQARSDGESSEPALSDIKSSVFSGC